MAVFGRVVNRLVLQRHTVLPAGTSHLQQISVVPHRSWGAAELRIENVQGTAEGHRSEMLVLLLPCRQRRREIGGNQEYFKKELMVNLSALWVDSGEKGSRRKLSTQVLRCDLEDMTRAETEDVLLCVTREPGKKS